MTTADPALAPPARPVAEQLILKIPFWGKIQNTVYSLGLIQWAVGVITALYILITQGTYFGRTNKIVWDGLNNYLHFKAVPWIGPWMWDNWDLGRHLYFRVILESLFAYVFVAMIVPKLATKQKKKVPLVHRIMIFFHIPSPYQGRATVRFGPRRGQPRREDTSVLQYVFLFPSVWLTSLAGQVVASVIIFVPMALLHRHGYGPSWFAPEGIITAGPIRIPWVPIIIGIAGGRLWGRAPAGKAGADIQRRWLDVRLSVYYLAERILHGYKDGEIPEKQALDELTGLPDAKPSQLYPATYRRWYEELLARRAPARPTSKLNKFTSWAVVFGLVILGAYGVYAQRWGIPRHDLWIPSW